MLDWPDGEHDESEGSPGGVKAVGTVDQKSDALVQAFMAGIRSHRRVHLILKM